MAVYPFYVESLAEGRATPISGGCRRKDGSQRTVICQRNEGGILIAFTIEQNSYVNEDGKRVLECVIYDSDGKAVATKETYY